MKRIIVIVIVLAILAVVGYFGYQQFLAPVEETPTPELDLSARAALPEVVSAEGFVVPAQQSELSMQVGGQIVEIPVSESDPVEKGQTLVRLDSTDQQKAVEQAEAGVTQAEAAVASAQAALDQALAGPTDEAIAQARAAVQRAKAQLDQVKAGHATVDGPGGQVKLVIRVVGLERFGIKVAERGIEVPDAVGLDLLAGVLQLDVPVVRRCPA